jgi:hypothetical protein
VSASTGVLWRILREGNPVAVIYYPESATREDLLEQAELMAPPERKILRASDIEAAFRDPEAIVLLTLDDEVGAVEALDQRREALLDRTAPVVLFLLCDGSGERRLQEAYALASWIRGREYDPTRTGNIDADSARRAFEERAGQTPEAWLEAWQADGLPDTLENNLLAHEALLLTGDA